MPILTASFSAFVILREVAESKKSVRTGFCDYAQNDGWLCPVRFSRANAVRPYDGFINAIRSF